MRKRIKRGFTVVGLQDGQSFVDFLKAVNIRTAIEAVKKDRGEDIELIAGFKGEHFDLLPVIKAVDL